ncbi:MAG: hypothetical protein IJW75_02575 [Alphaproteobacteria bacterium]|nr:hypothetical protein [Alphaproteobacteria bacterium]
MNKFYLYAFTALLSFSSSFAVAQNAEGIDSFKQDKNSWRRKEDVKEEISSEPVQKIKDGISKHALRNILEAERVFCYNVDKAEKNYAGYTINGMALTGFCGILPQNDKDLFIREFFYKENNTSNIVANCIISPKIMLRFVRGIDNTDVLLSSPCQSFTIFYGGKLKSFNAEPAAQIIDAFANIYAKSKIDFVSPALLDQLMPIGVAKTPEHRTLISEKKGNAPVRNWGSANQESPATEQKAQNKGWNRLKK